MCSCNVYPYIYLSVPHFLAQSKVVDPSEKLAISNAAFSLLLPGKILYLSALLSQTKFKSRGNKAGALAGWKLLEKSGLAKLVQVKAQRGTDKVNGGVYSDQQVHCLFALAVCTCLCTCN